MDSFLGEDYGIQRALPHLSNIKNDINPIETKLTASIFLVGDTLLNESFHAAMLSGKRPAEGIASINSTSFEASS